MNFEISLLITPSTVCLLDVEKLLAPTSPPCPLSLLSLPFSHAHIFTTYSMAQLTVSRSFIRLRSLPLRTDADVNSDQQEQKRKGKEIESEG